MECPLCANSGLMHRSKVYLYFGSLETHSQYRSATVQTYVRLGAYISLLSTLLVCQGSVTERPLALQPAMAMECRHAPV